MQRIYNFSAGPAMMPLPVLARAAWELPCYADSGMSIMEMSHRTPLYEGIVADAEQALRRLMHIDDNYAVLFLHGGATGQFAGVAMNLMNKSQKADYLITGNFAKNAYAEAKKYGAVREAASSADRNFTYIPTAFDFDPDADYVHLTTNNTIFGTTWQNLPDTGSVPLVADMSSDILSKPYDVSRFGLIYAGAQKNIGPAGVCVVIVRRELMGKAQKACPSIWDYALAEKNGSMYNTPSTYTIYMMKLCLEWLEETGGVEAIEKVNREKSALLYDYIDASGYYTNPVEKAYRSIMNVPFVTGDEKLDALFVKEAEKAGLKSLKGHRLVGGMRASIYNAMPVDGVKALIDFMAEFAKKNPR